MNGLLLVPAALSFLVLGAHFLRSGHFALVALALALVALLSVRRPWVPRVVQVALVLGAAEWIRTMVELVRRRTAAGEPFVRLVVILGGVAVVAVLAALLFQSARLRRWYGRA